MKNINLNNIAIAMCVYLSSITGVSAQMGIGTTIPDQSAILDLSSTEQGLLPPRLTTTERDLITNPAEGLVIYNTTDKCLQYWNNTTWKCAVGGNGDSSQSSGGMSLNYPYATKLKFKDVISLYKEKATILLTDQGELYGCGHNYHGIISQTATTGKVPLGKEIHSPRAFKNIPAKVRKIVAAGDQTFGFITEENKAYFVGQKHYLMGKYSAFRKNNPNNGSSYIDIPEWVEAVPTVLDMAANGVFSVLVDDKGDAHYAGSFWGGNSGYNTFVKPTGVPDDFKYLRVWIPYWNSKTVILEGNNGKYYVTAENIDKDYGLPHKSNLAKGLNWINYYSSLTIVEMSGLPSGVKFKDFQASLGYTNYNLYFAALSEDGDIYSWGGHYHSYPGISETTQASSTKPPYEKVEPTDLVKYPSVSNAYFIRKPIKLKKPDGTQKYTDMHIQNTEGQDSAYLLDNKVLYRYGAQSSSIPNTTATHVNAPLYSSVGNSIMFAEEPFHEKNSSDYINKYQSFRKLTAFSGISEPQNIIINPTGRNLFLIDKNSSLWGIGENFDHRLCTGHATYTTTTPKPMLNGNFDKSGWNDNPEPL